MAHNDSQEKKFYFLHYTRKSVKSCCIAIDTPDYANASDAERGDLACRQCQFFCWPMTLVIDFITFPYRGPKHLIKKCCGNNKKSKKNNKK